MAVTEVMVTAASADVVNVNDDSRFHHTPQSRDEQKFNRRSRERFFVSVVLDVVK
jgi:hypothetical protein